MKQRTNWKKVVLEAFMIVLSVLLALFINEWNTNRNEREETHTMMKNITAEIRTNQDLVEQLIPYHKTVIANLQEIAMKDSLESELMENDYFNLLSVAPKGVVQGDFHNIAWSIAKEERIANRISFEQSQLLFSIYEQQSRVLKTIERIIDFLGTREIHRKELIEESTIVLALEWNEMITQEEDLLMQYKKTLKELED